MVKCKDFTSESKTLPTIQTLQYNYGISYNSARQCFEKKLNFIPLKSEEVNYSLADFISDYYEMEFLEFRQKFENHLGCKINDRGYIIGLDNGQLLPIRNLAYFANKENKFAKELGVGRRRGDWIKTIYQNIGITTSQTTIVVDFISKTIKEQALNSNDIIMLKYLKKIFCNIQGFQ